MFCALFRNGKPLNADDVDVLEWALHERLLSKSLIRPNRSRLDVQFWWHFTHRELFKRGFRLVQGCLKSIK